MTICKVYLTFVCQTNFTYCQTNWLFPHRYRLIGWLIFVPSVILGLATLYADFEWSVLDVILYEEGNLKNLFNHINLTNELAALGVIAGLMLAAFSREKIEDEMIGQLRLEALQWSVYANYLILAIAILTLYNGAFFNVMIYNMFTILLVFIGRFRWLIYRNNHQLTV